MDDWLEQLQSRHHQLTFQELRRALVALSNIYVHRRHSALSCALSTKGKRAAFASFYGPLHFMLIRHIACALDFSSHPVAHILDLGCGTGVGGAAWARALKTSPSIAGIDCNRWAVNECKFTYRALKVKGCARHGDIVQTAKFCGQPGGIVSSYTINELSDNARNTLLDKLLGAIAKKWQMLIIEPIAKRPIPWWSRWVEAFAPHGARSDTWEVPVDLPPQLAQLDSAARLRHQVLKGRSLFVRGSIA